MAFDPDAFLAEGGGTAVAEFDPDKFLAEPAPAFDPDAFLAEPAKPTSSAVGDFVRRVPAGIASAAAQVGQFLLYGEEQLGKIGLGSLPGTVLRAVGAPVKEAITDPAKQYARDIQDRAAADYGVDPARDEQFASKVASGVGSIVPIIASGPAAPLTAAALMGESQRQDAEAHGAGEGEQLAAATLGAGVGLLSEALMGLPQLVRVAKTVQATAPSAARAIGEQAVRTAGREATQEALEQTAQNLIANTAVGYDPERKTTEGVLEAAAVGAIVGGPLGATTQAAVSRDEKKIEQAVDSDVAQILTQPPDAAVETTQMPAETPLDVPRRTEPTTDEPPIQTETVIEPVVTEAGAESLYPTDDLAFRGEGRVSPSEVTRVKETTNDRGQTVYAISYTRNGQDYLGYSDNPVWELHERFGAKPTEATPPPSTPEPQAQPTPEAQTRMVGEESAQVEAASNDWTQATATLPSLETPTTPAEPEKAATPIGILPPGSQQLSAATAALGAGIKKTVSAIKNIATFHDFRRSLLNWSARNQKSSGEIHKAGTDILKAVPDETKRAAITNWIQAGGDTAVLQQRAAGSKDLKLRRGYQAALNLSPNEIAIAQKVRQTYDTLLQRAKAHGIEINELENYVNQIWKRQPLRDFAASSNRRLSESIRFAKKRYYASFFDGEQAGLKPETKDISKLLPIYINEVNNAISAKQFVAEMAKGKAADGRPLLAPRGGAKTIEGEGEGKVYLVFPEQVTKDTSDYEVLAQPALHAWRWRGADENGNPIMVQGDLAVHPDAYSHLENVLGQSALRKWYRSPSENPLADIPKAAVKFLVDDVQQVAKATMLGFLSPFHQVQEGTHAIGHKVNPFGGIPEINLSDPAQMDAAQHGLMLLPDRVSSQQFREGLDGSSRNILSNLLGALGGAPGKKLKEWADGYQHYLFHEYIPGLKLKTYEHILERNSKRYEKEMARGDVSLDQVKYLSAQQSNAAYGHLNYADMGRNPTMQHIAQALLLAPDFLEARGRFAGQAVKGVLTKSGREQAVALATLAVTQFVLARILNQLLDDDPHWDHPFEVIKGNRRYTMRSVPEDIYKAFKNTRQFITGRLSPLIGRGALEGLSGVNYRGEPTDFSATITNILAGFVPLTIQPATRGLTETGRDNPVSPFEQLLGSSGIHVSRFSPVSEVYQLSKEWVEKHGKEYGLDKRRAVYPISEYQQLRYALDDGDFDKARAEIKGLMESKKISKGEIATRFRGAINHPFTGTVRTDREFEKSLDERGKKIFKAAKERRVLLAKRLMIALKEPAAENREKQNR